MDENRIFHLLAGFSAVLLLIRSIRTRTLGFAAASLLVVVSALAGVVFFLDVAGYVTLAVWGALVVVPLAGQRVLGRLVSQQRYGAAARFSRVLRLLHPADGWWERHRLFHALSLSRAGRSEEAAAVLEALEASSKRFAREARIHLLRERGRWEDVVAWLSRNVPDADAQRDPSLLPIYLRALGETGDLERLVALYAACDGSLERAGLAGLRSLCQLFVFAFTGRADRVAALFAGSLSDYPEPLRRFWGATAELAGGVDEPARAVLDDLLAKADASLRTSVRRRIEHPPVRASAALGPAAAAALARIERARDQEERYGPVAASFRPYATYGLMVPILAMFAAELALGGSEDVETLLDLGAAWPDAIFAGAWWRLGAATLLHYGSLHLVMNLVGLYLLGPYVEFALGRVRYVIVYFVAGVGTMLAVVFACRLGLLEPQLLVGASGAIMGLIGATCAVLLRGRRLEGASVARRRLRGVVFIVAAQAAFDFLTPQVSALSHLGGAIIGFLIASVMAHRVTPKRERALRAS